MKKKWKNILKIINITHSIYALMYVLKKEEKKIGKILKKYFSQFQSIFRIPVGQRWRWRWRWRWRATLGSETHRDYCQHILGPRKNLKRTVMSTIYSLTHPLPGGTQNLGQAEKHFFDTFFEFWPWRGPKCDKNHL